MQVQDGRIMWEMWSLDGDLVKLHTRVNGYD